MKLLRWLYDSMLFTYCRAEVDIYMAQEIQEQHKENVQWIKNNKMGR